MHQSRLKGIRVNFTRGRKIKEIVYEGLEVFKFEKRARSLICSEATDSLGKDLVL